MTQAEGCCLPTNKQPREVAGRGWLPGNEPSVGIYGLGGAGSQGDMRWGGLISLTNADSELAVRG